MLCKKPQYTSTSLLFLEGGGKIAVGPMKGKGRKPIPIHLYQEEKKSFNLSLLSKILFKHR